MLIDKAKVMHIGGVSLKNSIQVIFIMINKQEDGKV